MQATYLKATQSARTGDKIEYDSSSVRHQQLLERGFIKLDNEIETKPHAPTESKVAAPKETKKRKKAKGTGDAN